MSRTLEIVKADALRRLRPFLRREPSRFRPKARAERDAAIRAYLAEVVRAQLFELIGGQALDPEIDLKAWLEGVLAEAAAGADHHPAVAATAKEHQDSLFDIVRTGYLAEMDRRRRSWEAAGMGGARITPEMLAEEAEAKRELEEALARKKEDRKALMPPSPEAPQLEPEPPPLAWDKDVSIIFLSDERVQVKRGDQFATMNYAEFGFEDKRNGKPDQAWVLLREMAENKGVLQKQDRRVPESVLKPARDRDKELHRALEVQARQWAKTQKHVETIRKRLREHFQIPDGDPVPATAAGYQTAFQLGCGPSYKF
jgi:hypothetical protein